MISVSRNPQPDQWMEKSMKKLTVDIGKPLGTVQPELHSQFIEVLMMAYGWAKIPQLKMSAAFARILWMHCGKFSPR